ncbi:hypothetical protein BSY239_681 [Hydrogenophaga sp. RAC07]|uniref:DNA transfer protein p32 n=1 Tax=Hydrogenophaga sp. RAC07 TaxID=1842537 RepID=UPI0008585F5F|nr:DNA transfer protein p32 [Hydrogenophaga sp. RAC07]AOF85742.1 hypothetical protein BSY239_681 [Hydrogenophaga sp. RAC07]
MSFGIVAAVAGPVIGGLIGADAAGDASDAQSQSAARTDATNRYVFDKQVELQEPFRQTGLQANNRLLQLLGMASGGDENGSLMRDFSMNDFEADPGYQFRMDEGTRAVEGGAAARGNLLSGAAQKALVKYGQGVASEEYGNAFNRFTGQQTNKFNRLKSMIDTGTGASTQIGNAAQTFGNATAQTNAAVGNAQAAGAIGQANAWSNSVGQVSNNLMQLIQKPGSSYPMRPSSAEAYYGY